jgi:hypothetical protein
LVAVKPNEYASGFMLSLLAIAIMHVIAMFGLSLLLHIPFMIFTGFLLGLLVMPLFAS